MGVEGASGSKLTKAKVKNCLKTFLVHLFSHVGLCVLVVGYTVVGGFVFWELEHQTEEERKIEMDKADAELNKTRQEHVSNLWVITDKLNVLYEHNWTLEVEAELERFERAVKERKNLHAVRIPWTFTSALLYSVSIITTIGYGNVFPETMEGKLFTMLYAVVGVPIMLLWVSNIGNLMAHAFKFVYFHGFCCGASSSKRSRKTVQSQFAKTKSLPANEHRPTKIEFSLNNDKCKTVLLDSSDISPTASKKSDILRRSMQNLDHSARQILFECAEYNLSQGDEPSRELIEQLGCTPYNVDEPDESTSSDVQSVIDLGPNGLGRFSATNTIPPPPKFDENEKLSTDYGFPSRNGSSRRGSLVAHGTPSRVPLLENSAPETEIEQLDFDSDEIVPSSNKQLDKRVPVLLVLLVVVLYIVLGAATFMVSEGWEFWNSAYFCFITLSTIGLGDMVPGKSLVHSGTRESTVQLIFCCFYLVIGLAIIAMSFNLVQEQVTLKVTGFARRIGILEDDL